MEDFKLQCQYDLQSAPGLDGWSAADLELLSDGAYQLLVDLLNSIEKGAPWPKAMLATRAVFLSKDENDTHTTPLPIASSKSPQECTEMGLHEDEAAPTLG